MKVVEKTVLNRPAAHVWKFIVTPEEFMKWNEKVTQMEARGRFVLNQPFVSHYIMSKKPMQCMSVVTRLEEGKLLQLHHSNPIGQEFPEGLECIETIALEERNGVTTVIKTVDIRNGGIPLWARPLIWLITTFGKRRGPDRLKDLCDNE